LLKLDAVWPGHAVAHEHQFVGLEQAQRELSPDDIIGSATAYELVRRSANDTRMAEGSTMALACWKCGASLKAVPKPLSRLSRCPECFADLYCCRMCRKFAPRYISKCSDERADPPQNKQGANFCDWFVPDPQAYSGHEKSAEEQAKDQLAALFGGASKSELHPEDGGDDAARDGRSTSDKALEEARKLFDNKK